MGCSDFLFISKSQPRRGRHGKPRCPPRCGFLCFRHPSLPYSELRVKLFCGDDDPLGGLIPVHIAVEGLGHHPDGHQCAVVESERRYVQLDGYRLSIGPRLIGHDSLIQIQEHSHAIAGPVGKDALVGRVPFHLGTQGLEDGPDGHHGAAVHRHGGLVKGEELAVQGNGDDVWKGGTNGGSVDRNLVGAAGNASGALVGTHQAAGVAGGSIDRSLGAAAGDGGPGIAGTGDQSEAAAVKDGLRRDFADGDVGRHRTVDHGTGVVVHDAAPGGVITGVGVAVGIHQVQVLDGTGIVLKKGKAVPLVGGAVNAQVVDGVAAAVKDPAGVDHGLGGTGADKVTVRQETVVQRLCEGDVLGDQEVVAAVLPQHHLVGYGEGKLSVDDPGVGGGAGAGQSGCGGLGGQAGEQQAGRDAHSGQSAVDRKQFHQKHSFSMIWKRPGRLSQ